MYDCFYVKGTEVFFNETLLKYIKHGNNSKLLPILKDAKNLCQLKDSAGRTLLHFAAEYGNSKYVEYLINSGAKVDAQDSKKQTPLMLAMDAEKLVTVRVLLEANADIFVPDINGHCALGRALRKDQWKKKNIVEAFLDRVTVASLSNSRYVASDVFHRDCPLYYFVQLRDIEVTRILLESGSPVDAQWLYSGVTALHIAAGHLDVENIKLLLKYNADVNAKTNDGKTPLACISYIADKNQSKALDTLMIFLNAGATLIDHDDRTILAKSLLQYGDIEIIRVLLQYHQIDVNFVDRFGMTPLIYLACNTHPNVFEEVPGEFDVNFRDPSGKSMLYYAMTAGNLSSVQFLLDRVADINAQDKREFGQLYEVGRDKYNNIVLTEKNHRQDVSSFESIFKDFITFIYLIFAYVMFYLKFPIDRFKNK